MGRNMDHNYSLSGTSLRLLDRVHDDLARVARRAIVETNIDFGISEGIRTLEKQKLLLYQNKTTILNSQHLPQGPDGLSHAIDVFAWVEGQAVWSNKYYGPIVQAFTTAAIALGVQLQFGHLWLEFIPGKGPDSVHIQLNQKYYKG